MVVYDVTEDVDYLADLTTMVQQEAAAESATVTAASPGRLLSIDYQFASSKLPSTTPAATSTAAAAIDYAVKNVSVVLCHPSTGIPSVDEYFTGKWRTHVTTLHSEVVGSTQCDRVHCRNEHFLKRVISIQHGPRMRYLFITSLRVASIPSVDQKNLLKSVTTSFEI